MLAQQQHFTTRPEIELSRHVGGRITILTAEDWIKSGPVAVAPYVDAVVEATKNLEDASDLERAIQDMVWRTHDLLYSSRSRYPVGCEVSLRESQSDGDCNTAVIKLTSDRWPEAYSISVSVWNA